jgi:hypothetical protein
MNYSRCVCRDKQFQALLVISLTCVFGISFFGLAQEKIGSFEYVTTDVNDLNPPYVSTQSIEGPSQPTLSWSCSYASYDEGKPQGEATGITILIKSPSRFDTSLVPASYTFDGQPSGTIRFFSKDNVLSYLTGVNDAFGNRALSASTVRLEFINSDQESLSFLFDLVGLKEAISRLPCASYMLEEGGLTLAEVFNDPAWVNHDAKSVEEKIEGGTTLLQVESSDGKQHQAIIVSNTRPPLGEGALILKCEPMGESEEGNFETIITRSKWQSGEGFTKAGPLTDGKTSLRVTINRETINPKHFNFSSYESGEIYYYDGWLSPYWSTISFTLRTSSQITVDFQTFTGEDISYLFDLAGVRDAVPNLPCLSPNLIVGAWKNITGDSEYGYLSDGSDENNVDFEFYANGTGKTSRGDSFTWEVDEVGFVRATIEDRQELFMVITPDYLASSSIVENGLFGSAQYVPMSDEEYASFETFASAPVITDQGTDETIEETVCAPSDPLDVEGSFQSKSKEYERWAICPRAAQISPEVADAISSYFGLASRLTNQLQNNDWLFTPTDADELLNQLSDAIYRANFQSYSKVLEHNKLISPITGQVLDSPLQWAIDQARFEQGVAEDFIKNRKLLDSIIYDKTSKVKFFNITATLYIPVLHGAVGASLDMQAGLPPYIYEDFPEYRWALQQIGILNYSYEDRATREAIGVAAIFIYFDLSQEQYEKYMTGGVLPKIP